MSTDTLTNPIPIQHRKNWARACEPIRKATARGLMELASMHGFPAQVDRWRARYELDSGDENEWGVWDGTWQSLLRHDPILWEKRQAERSRGAD